MNSDPKLQGGMGEDDPVPTSPDPLSPGRTEVDPMKEEGIDELPDNGVSARLMMTTSGLTLSVCGRRRIMR